MKKILWMLVSGLMVLSLVMASCGPAEEEEEEEEEVVIEEEEEEEVEEEEEEVIAPSPDVPKYGGTITLVSPWESWDLLALGKSVPEQLAYNRLWDGDWAKGPAGGYGTNEVLWEESTNIPDFKTGFLAESWRFDVDSEAGTVTTIFQIKQGIHYARVDSEAGRLVNGREVTADDVAWNMDQLNNNPDAMNYRFFGYLIEGIHPVKTGPWEVSVTHPISEHLGNIMRLVDNHLIFPPELYQTYGYEGVTDWKYAVGTGPYIIIDSVPNNMTTLERNPNYWLTDPVGPGKGNQLPYIERVKVAVIPDRSTQLAALRTARVDQMGGLSLEEKTLTLRQCPEMKSAARGGFYIGPVYMRVDRPPFSDIRVRRAAMMAIDIEEINESLYEGLGTYPSWPYYYTPAYADLYMGLDDPMCPDTVRELYSYNPDKARQLLIEAGYPDGFKTELTIAAAQADNYAIIQDYLSRVGIEVALDLVAEMGALMGQAQSREYDMLSYGGVSPPSTYPEQYQYTGGSYLNGSILNDPYVNEMAEKAQIAALTDFYAAMKITKELMPYVQDLALCIQFPRYPMYSLWWPWLKNYSGETSVGYFFVPYVPYVWIDTDLKKAMGH